jgi:hypothetical protein
MVEAHTQAQMHRYIMHFPEHPAREGDPHYVDFNAYHRAHRGAARCYIGERIGYGECSDAQGALARPPEWRTPGAGVHGQQPGLELHHAHVEFSLTNGISLVALEVDYPGISNPAQVGAWVESGANFRWYCAYHHRSQAGAHSASHSDFEGSQYVLGLITKAPDKG